MKEADALARYRDHPHLITQGVRRNQRWPMQVGDAPVEAPYAMPQHVFTGPGLVDGTGAVTAVGRGTIVARFKDAARSSRARHCVVWGPKDCTWFDTDGRHRHGRRPPEGEIADPWINRRHNASVESCRTIELPGGGEWSHLCVRRIDRDLVEIAPGEPMILADFDEPAVPGRPDPAARMLAADGSLRPPWTYRGQVVTGVRDDWKLLGPVQPGGDGEILRNPWPDDVRDACQRVAGMPLAPALTDAAWRAIDPERPDIVYVGVHEAA